MITSWFDSKHSVGRAGLLCLIGTFGLLFFSACGGGGDDGGNGSNCPDGQREATVDGETACYTTCSSNSDCDTAAGESCNSGVCIGGDDNGGGDGDAGMMSDVDDDNDDQDTEGPGDDQDTEGPGDDEDTGSTDEDTGDDNECQNPGTRTCSGIITCFSENGCADYEQGSSEQQQCIQSCIDEGTCDARTRYDNYSSCRRETCGSQSASATCVYDNCGTQLEECGLTGTVTCSERTKCTLGCQIKAFQNNDNQDMAIQAARECITNECESGTLDAQKQATERRTCQENNNCNTQEASQTCGWDNCEQENRDCGLTGSKSCRDIFTCQEDCLPGPNSSWTKADGQCIADCWYTGTKEEQVKRLEYNECLDQNGCRDQGASPNCALDNCLDPADTCGLIGDTHQSCDAAMECALINGNGIRTCQYQSPESVQREYNKALACGGENGCFGQSGQQAFNDCMKNNCSDSWSSCNFIDGS